MSDFASLHPAVQRWVWEQGWPSLRPIQEAAIAPILAADRDVLISAPTAGGKTEAAFLPMCSHLATHPGEGVRVLCVSPLRALISDQARRLEPLFEAIGERLQPWHGDITRGRAQFWRTPACGLLITPESLEAMLMKRAGHVRRAFASLQYVVVDEVHAFVGRTRGAQLLSLLNRLEVLIGHRPPRIGLSATFGDRDLAARYLSPDAAAPAVQLQSPGGGGELQVGMLCVRPNAHPLLGVATDGNAATDDATTVPAGSLWVPPPPPQSREEADALDRRAERAESGWVKAGIEQIAEHMFQRLRGRSNLVFANARARVELLTDALVGLATEAHLPNEFFAHHGSLSREIRTGVEARLREGELPTTVCCTSTLELGIDIGDVHCVAQVGPAPSIAGLKQRVGRSGRRMGAPQILRQYVELRAVTPNDSLIHTLQLPLVQAIATVEGLRAGDFESHHVGDLHLSTLVQQILARIDQGQQGERAADLYRELCAPRGPFAGVTPALFADVLRSLGQHGVIEQIVGDRLLPGHAGEAMLASYDFYATFHTPEEFRVYGEGRLLGTIPLENPLTVGQLLVFAGRRWSVKAVDLEARALMVERGPRGKPPKYDGGALAIDERVHARMRALLAGVDVPAYVDPMGSECLRHARFVFHAAGLGERAIADGGDHVALFHWAGTRVGATLAALFACAGIEGVEQAGPAVLVRGVAMPKMPALLNRVLAEINALTATLLTHVCPLTDDKHDHFLSHQSLAKAYIARHIDVPTAQRVLESLCIPNTERPQR